MDVMKVIEERAKLLKKLGIIPESENYEEAYSELDALEESSNFLINNSDTSICQSPIKELFNYIEFFNKLKA